jgi:predicted AAA+ superfamily ATPase
MQRKITKTLLKWKESAERKPLVLTGARQVGKTYALKAFASEHYPSVAYFSFDNNQALSAVFEPDFDTARIIRELETISGQPIKAGETLLIWDEIQEVPKALASLKYFAEEAPQYHVVVVGSLLGVAINHGGFSFPVGKIDRLRMYPLDFEEFLWSQGKIELGDLIAAGVEQQTPLSEAMHHLAMELFKQYLIIGGMPAAVTAYTAAGSYLAATAVQGEIIADYRDDMGKYASKSDTAKIRSSFDSIPRQLAKPNPKFQYKLVQEGATATRFSYAIDWLVTSGIVNRCNNIETIAEPLSVYENENKFKLYLQDTALLVNMSGLSLPSVLHLETVDNIFLGAVAENYISSALATQGFPQRYWTSGNTAEVDFILGDSEAALPIEVKKGLKTTSRSLDVYNATYHPDLRIRFSAKNIGRAGNLLSLPLYAATWYFGTLQNN